MVPLVGDAALTTEQHNQPTNTRLACGAASPMQGVLCYIGGIEVERLTTERSWEEAEDDLWHECGYSDIWKRLNEIENILGKEYDIDRLRELVEADRDGRCVLTPCKIGDVVWFITGINGRTIKQAEIAEIYIGDGALAFGVTIGYNTFTLQEHEVFFTRESAEEYLNGGK